MDKKTKLSYEAHKKLADGYFRDIYYMSGRSVDKKTVQLANYHFECAFRIKYFDRFLSREEKELIYSRNVR